MRSLDMRTRTKADVRVIDPADFFERELPSLIRSHGGLATPGATEFGIRPTSFITPSGSWTLACEGGRLTASPGSDGRTAIRIGDLDGDSDFKFLTNVTATALNTRGAEWSNQVRPELHVELTSREEADS